jgi:hypothetical protein
VIYGNELRAGSKIELEAWGEYSGVTGNTFRLGFAYGITTAGGLLSTGVELCGTALTAVGTTPTAWPWHMHYSGIVTSVSTTGCDLRVGDPRPGFVADGGRSRRSRCR